VKQESIIPKWMAVTTVPMIAILDKFRDFLKDQTGQKVYLDENLL